jgi:hypothetical protein
MSQVTTNHIIKVSWFDRKPSGASGVEIGVSQTTRMKKFIAPNGTAVEGGCVTSEDHPWRSCFLDGIDPGGRAGMARYLPHA